MIPDKKKLRIKKGIWPSGRTKKVLKAKGEEEGMCGGNRR
jgi:hypothetical protein